MACKSLTKYSKDCKGVTGGVAKLWLISYSDLTNITGSLDKYTVDETGNLIDEIGVTTKKFVSIGLIKNTVGVNENYTKTAETNSFEITTELSLVISNISIESRTFVSNLADAGEVSALVQLRSGKFIALGLNGYLEVSTVASGTGVAGADLNGYTITLTGMENDFIRLVDPVIVPTIIEA
ncbi:hypothetical protein GEO21_21660 [Sphingobacterium faecium]|uniref:hypothetical protein n=1 Tax=Sphingobacterium faecium TaxID=34087 RepID=UPI0012920D6E|nr:hypothetical protein [Sphingobacterium faecium]MQP30093.1 hypothetical protein [Sphingobacterium faecium]